MKDDDLSGQQQARNKRLPVHLDPSQGEQTQFKPGQSGNPKGRPKGRKSLSTMIQDMLDDEKFIDRLSEKIKQRVIDAEEPDPEFQGTPMKAIITTALVEAIDPTNQPKARASAREWLAKYGFGTKVDVTSDGKRISEAPKVISVIHARQGDAPTKLETE